MNLVNTTVLFCYLLILSRAVDTATSTLSTFGNITASSTTVISTPVIPNSSPTSHEEAGPTNRTYERQVWHFEWFITSDDNTVDAKASNNITRSNTNTADTIGDAEVSENNPASDNITADISSGAVAFVGFQTFKDIPAFAPSGTFGSGGENEYGNIELFRISYVYDGSSSVWDASDFGSAQAELDASIRSNLAGLFENWRNWSSPSNIIQVTPSNNKSQLRPPDPGDITVALANNFSSFEECRQLYDAFDSIFYNSGFLLGGAEFSDALDSIIQARYPRDGSTQIELRCPFGLRQVSDDGTDIKTASKDSCTLRVDDPTAWEYFSVDHNLIAFQQGRIDEDYVRYNYFDSLSDPIDTSVSPFARHNQFRNSSFSTTLRSIMGAGVGLKCTLKNPCLLPPDCAATGTRYYATRGKPIYHSRWSYLAIWAIRNINEQLNNQYVAVKGAAIEATLDTFNIDDYLPKPNKDFGLFNALTGLGAVFGAVGGFLPPVIAPLAGSLGAIIPAVGAEFERSIAADPVYGALVNQKKFAPIVRRIYKNFVDTLDSVATDLLDGKKIGGEADILDMMKDGVWLNPDQLLEVSSAEDQIFFEIFSRAINQLWKSPTSNKMWVLFIDLGDLRNSTGRCTDHLGGPQLTKFCQDGGVYYAFNYIEAGDLRGYFGYPWGADKLKTQVNIDPAWITEGSVRSYQLAKNSNGTLDPFNFTTNGTIATEAFLRFANTADFIDHAGRYPGSWTLPVCNSSTWGAAWSTDFTKLRQKIIMICFLLVSVAKVGWRQPHGQRQLG